MFWLSPDSTLGDRPYRSCGGWSRNSTTPSCMSTSNELLSESTMVIICFCAALMSPPMLPVVSTTNARSNWLIVVMPARRSLELLLKGWRFKFREEEIKNGCLQVWKAFWLTVSSTARRSFKTCLYAFAVGKISVVFRDLHKSQKRFYTLPICSCAEAGEVGIEPTRRSWTSAIYQVCKLVLLVTSK